MKKPARRLVGILGVLAVLGLVAEVPVACATGSGLAAGDVASDSGSSSGADSSSGAGLGRDSGSGSGSSSGGPSEDSGAGSSSGSSSGSGSGGPPDGGEGNEAGGGSDAGSGADSGPDASPVVIFGPTCPAGTIYTESFASDPVASGTFMPLVGSYTYDAAGSTFSLAASSANTQLWIGPRPSWTNYTVSVQVRIDTSGGNGGINFRMESTPATPGNNAGQMYYAGIAPNQVLLGIENNTWNELAGPTATFAVGTFYTLEVAVSGASLSVSVDGTSYVTSVSDGTFASGSLGLRTYASGMTYRALSVTCN